MEFVERMHSMVWYGNGMVNVDLYSAIITKVSNALSKYLSIVSLRSHCRKQTSSKMSSTEHRLGRTCEDCVLSLKNC